MLNTQQKLKLDDGRVVDCPSPAEARFLWSEITSAAGFYRQAAARLRPGDIVLDIGANIGLSAMLFADVCPGARVLAIEPVPATFRCLERNLRAYVPRAVAVRTAVGAESGVHALTWYPHAPANSGLYADRAADDEATRAFLRNSGLDDEAIDLITADLHRGEQIDVEVTTVSAILDEYAPDAEIGVLKVDVERAELDVLRGVAPGDWPRIRTVVAEVHDTDGRLARCRELLGDHGLTTQIRQDPNLRGTDLHEVYASRVA
ncbi:FkbM family methyltransferase [Nocardia sienata]|uniref:FkbM family methyltransferase n=1 Tax=Nocardia sienata TaxID=248552 RepID=UPI0007A52936|nr:FkbM family methyltransferase [Nocardia sienata]